MTKDERANYPMTPDELEQYNRTHQVWLTHQGRTPETIGEILERLMSEPRAKRIAEANKRSRRASKR